MDIVKYIGLFLLKNEQCYINGLGTLQLVRRAASYDGQYLHAASYEIVMVPGGNVDESLANFIATNEQISISKAAEALKEYAATTKTLLQSGQEVPLPFFGSFVADNGRVGFATDAMLQYKNERIAAQKGVSMQQNERPVIPHQPYIPTTPIGSAAAANTGAPPQMQQPYPGTPPHPHVYSPEEERRGGLNWGRILFVLLLLVVLAGGTYYAYKRYLEPRQKQAEQPVLTFPEMTEEPYPEEEMETPFTDSAAMDSNETDIPDTTNAVTPPTERPAQQQVEAVNAANNVQKPQSSGKTYRVVINTYDSKSEAYKRSNSLNARGNRTMVIEEDTNYFFVVMPVKINSADSSRIIDSLSSSFNPTGVFVY